MGSQGWESLIQMLTPDSWVFVNFYHGNSSQPFFLERHVALRIIGKWLSEQLFVMLCETFLSVVSIWPKINLFFLESLWYEVNSCPLSFSLTDTSPQRSLFITFQHPWAHPGYLGLCQPIPPSQGQVFGVMNTDFLCLTKGCGPTLLPCSHLILTPRQPLIASRDCGHLLLSACGSVGSTGCLRWEGSQGVSGSAVCMLLFKCWNLLIHVEKGKELYMNRGLGGQ